MLHSGGFAAEVSDMLSQRIAPSVSCHAHDMKTFKQWSNRVALTERTTPLMVVFIVATLENEQPPEDAGACVRFFNRRTHASDLLDGRIRYAVLGLGDSNLLLDRQTTTAKDCNQVARRLDTRLASLGAMRCHPVGETDDRTGNTELEPWLDSLVGTLCP